MKIQFLIAIGFLVLGTSAFAADEDLIINNSIVTSTAKLLNAKHDGECVLPKSTDVHWMCLGALFPVMEPTITPSSCGFQVQIVCPGETAQFTGRRTAYFLQMPQGQNTTVKETPTTISFNDFQLFIR